MNTERPENDDAAREPERTGSGEATTETPGAGKGVAGPEASGTERAEPLAEQAEQAEQAEAGAAVGEKGPAEADGRVPAATGGGQAEGEKEQAVAPAEAADTDEADSDSDADAGEVAGADDTAASAVGAPAGAAGTDVTPEPGAAARPDGGSSPAPRRRSPLLVASVAAAVLLVGGGGAYLTAQAGGGSGGAGAPSGDGTPPALALDDYAGNTSGGGTSGIAPGEPNPYGVTYTAAGDLPDGPGSAPVYRATGTVTKDEVARLAKALGVDGAPVADGDAWKVGSGNDGSGPVLRVNRQAPGMWTFTRFTPGTDNCTGGIAKCTKDPVAPAVDPVSEAAAKKAAAPVLKAVGQEDAELDASQVMGAQRIVNADPAIDGLPSYGWTTGVTVSAQGAVVGANGQLKTPVKGDTYPLLSAEEALAAMNAAPGTEHRMGIGGCASPVPLKDRLESPCGSSAATPQKQETVTIEDAVLGLAPHTSGGRQVLVPSWLFDVKASGAADDYTLTHPAVEPAYLASASTPTPTASAGGSSREVQVEDYTAEGDELVVSFTAGVCADYTVTADESGDRVKVTVTETPWPDKVCIMIAKEYHRTVRLDEPLGARQVVGSDGTSIPLEKPGARLPR